MPGDNFSERMLFIEQIRRHRRPRFIGIKTESGIVERYSSRPLEAMALVRLPSSECENLLNGKPVSSSEATIQVEKDSHIHTFCLEITADFLKANLPSRLNCSLSWTIHETGGPFGARSIRTVVVEGRPTSIGPHLDDQQSDVEMSLNFNDQIALRAGSKDCFQVLRGANLNGSIEDVMCMGGLIGSSAWCEAVWISPEAADVALDLGHIASLFRDPVHSEVIWNTDR